MKGTSQVSSQAASVDSSVGKGQSSSQGASASDASGAQFFDELLSILAVSEVGGDGFTSDYEKTQSSQLSAELPGFQPNVSQGTEAVEHNVLSSSQEIVKAGCTEIGTTAPEQDPASEAQQRGKNTTRSEIPGYTQGSLLTNYPFWPVPIQPVNNSPASEVNCVADQASPKSTGCVDDSSAPSNSGSPASDNQNSSKNNVKQNLIPGFLFSGMASYAAVTPSNQLSDPASSSATQLPDLKAAPSNAAPETKAGSAPTGEVTGATVPSSLDSLQELLSGISASQQLSSSAEQVAGSSAGSTAETVANHPLKNANSVNTLKALESTLAAMNAMERETQDPVSQKLSVRQVNEKEPALTGTVSGEAIKSSNAGSQNSSDNGQPVIIAATKITTDGSINVKVLSASDGTGALAGSRTSSASAPQSVPPGANVSQNAVQSQGRVAPSVANNNPQLVASARGQQKGTTSGSDGSPAKSSDQATAAIFAASPANQKSDVSFKQTLSNVPQNQADIVPDSNTTLITQSIVREVKMINQGGKSVVSLKLEPESLGSVVLQVTSDGDKISAQFNVKTPDARAYLESSVPEIRQSLQTNGISVSHLTVSLSGNGTQTNHPQYRWAKQQQKFSTIVPTESDENMRNFGYNTMEMKL